MKIIRIIAFLMMCIIMVACGSSGGKDDATPVPTPTPSTPSYNFTGIVYGETGAPLPGVTIYVFSPSYTTVTDSKGTYSLNVSKTEHTMMSSRNGSLDVFRLFNLTSGGSITQPIMLYNSSVSPVNVVTNKSSTLTSNKIGAYSAKLDIPSGTFTVAGQKVSSVDISFEYLDNNKPFPVPLPSPDTLNSSDVIIGGKQAPSVMVAIKPALLSFDSQAELTLPNPHNLKAKRILRFDPETHRWVRTGYDTDTSPILISKGGVYGIFFEERKTGTVKGTAPAGSVVFAGDEIIKVPSDGNFSAVVTVPPDGTVNLLNLIIDSTDSSKNEVLSTSATFTSVPDQVQQVSFVQAVDVTVKTVTVETGSDSVVADGSSTVAVTATVTDTNDQTVEGVSVNFSTSAGTISPSIVSTKGGIAATTLTSALDVTGTVTITASAKGVYGKKIITFLPRPKKLELSLSKADGTSGFSVKSDNSDYLNVTATVLNSNNAPYADLGIKFKIEEDPTFHQTGQIIALDSTGTPYDPASIKTDKYGKAVIRFSSGVSEKANRTVNITATTGGLYASIPIQVIGTSITLTNDKSNLSSDKPDDKATLLIAVKDAGNNAIYNADVTASVSSGASGDTTSRTGWVSLSAGGQSDVDGVLRAKTDIKGEVKIAVTGKTIGKTTVKVESLGDSKIQIYSVTSESETFAITDPADDPVSVKTNILLPITVRASKGKTVVFSTTFGYWDTQLTKQVSEVSVDSDGYARASLRSPNAGLANVQIYYKDEPAISDTMQVAFYVPSEEATQISLQASNSVIAPRTSTVQNSITLTATVKNAQNQVVRNVPVAFSLDGTTTTGGGEYISPAVVYTNDLGIAVTQFYSGYLSSKSSGVSIRAAALTGTATPASVSVIIGGTPTSIIIGQSSLVTQTDTTYTLPMSVQVVDSKGNPVPNTKVTLGIWPTRYRTGYWTTAPCEPVILNQFNNEDADRDTILDTGEDGNTDGKLTPPSSAAGEVPPFVETGTTGSVSSGTVNFNLVYLKSSAVWIEAEVTATAVVLGTETKSVYTFWLPYLTSEACFLPDSPYNPQTLPSGSITMNATPNELLCNGTSKSTISARLTSYTGSPVSDVLVTFKLSGSGGFPYASTITGTTNSNGVATAEYQAPSKVSGTATITATATDPNSSQKVEGNVTIRLGIGSIQLQAFPAEISANGTATSTITATILNTQGNLFTDAEPVLFSIESGTGSLSSRTINTGTGRATVTYTAGRTAGTVTIKAELVNTGATATTTITLTGSNVGFIELLPTPSSIKADGATSSQIKATITDISGNPVTAGTPVTFTTTAGKFQNGSTTYTLTTPDNTGVAIVSLISGYSAETATVTCTAGGVSQSTTVTFTGSGTDPNAKPAYIQPAPIRNDSGDIACYNSLGQIGTCDSTTYTIANYPYPKTINVRGTPGNVTSKVAFTVYDTKGKPISITGGEKIRIDFQIISGPGGGEILLTPFDYANSNGEVSTLVRSGLKSGPVIVRAVYYKDKSVSTTSGQIGIGGGYPTGEGFSLSAQYLNISGLIYGGYSGLEDLITARLADEYGNNVSDGTIVSFKTYNTGGYMNPPAVSTSSVSPGAVGSKLISTAAPVPEAGFVSVTAEANGALSTRITSLAVVHEVGGNNILYAGTNGGGMYKSTNSGQTWTNISRSSTIAGQNRINPYINDVVVDPYNRNIVYAATGVHGSGNIYRSVDGGQTWNSNEPRQFYGVFSINSAVLALAVDDNNPNTNDTTAPRLWAGTDGNGIYTLDWQVDPIGPGGAGRFIQKYWWKASGNALTNYVNVIVKVRGTYGDSSIMYAVTAIGVYIITNGGST